MLSTERETEGWRLQAPGKLAHLLIVIAIWLAALAWIRPLALPDEGRYTDIARWMADSGDWLIPRVDGLPFLHKPPLYFWLEAAIIKALGPTVFAARLTSLASAVSMCACVFWLVRHFSGDHAARWSVAALALNPLFYGGAQFANLDMLVAALITATITFAVFAAQSPGRAHGAWLAAYAAAGLGVLAKGLVGAVLPGLVFLGWSLAARRPAWLAKAISPAGTLVFLIIVLPWFLAAEREFSGFAAYFVGYQHFQRFVGTGFNNPHGPWFYPAVLLVGMLPWTISPLVNWRSAFSLPARGSQLRVLGLVWFATVLVFFSVPRSKLVGYIFPLLPAFAILVGPWFASYRYRRLTAVIGASVCVCAAIIAGHVTPTGPVTMATKFKQQIAPDDNVVFFEGYLFDVAIALDRRQPIYVTGDWSRRAAELPDSIRRQFTEGRELDPRSGQVLIGAEGLKGLLSQAKPIWVWGEKAAVAANPELRDMPIMASQGQFVLLHRAATATGSREHELRRRGLPLSRRRPPEQSGGSGRQYPAGTG